MDFVITKVNGKDITEHADALRAFETSPEPILVEVRRSGSCLHNSALMSTAVQTEELDRVIYELPECEIDDDDDDIEFLLNDSLDYEVVTLNKKNGESLGLNLCFSEAEPQEEAASKSECFVFIDSVAKDGLAERDGRIRPGDQVLQVNGVSLTTQQQAKTLFAESESLQEVTILVSRFASKVKFNPCDIYKTKIR
ncbi:Hypothetical predicted protein [Cloeon dipterum]|uniref:PDZ domain-containing protein n=1 Tax=Cloeon dipterum TaxID=197152 RepID=A0A8S1BV30_9INSE|nr:Hypothetical predicted protein [Cloeon dipterum]